MVKTVNSKNASASQTGSTKSQGPLKHYKMFIGGKWVDAISGKNFETINPYTGKPWAVVPEGEAEDIDRAVKAARKAFEEGEWPSMLPRDRGRLLRKLASLIRRDADNLAITETTDNGKVIRESNAQMAIISDNYDYFGGWADKIYGDVIPVDRPDMLNYTLREPIGVVGAILAWNSPLMLATLKMSPALASGNTIVLKPAEQTPVTALCLAKLVEESGIPPGVVNVVTGYGETAGAALAAHRGVDKVSFTGGTKTGQLVAQAAGANITRLSLELGGKSPNIVFQDADIEAAANGVLAGIFAAAGQTCIAGSRLFVHRDVKDALLGKVVARARTIKLGDPTDPQTEMGPLAFETQLQKVKYYLKKGLEEGAKLLCGGKEPDDPALSNGLFVEPTVFDRVDNKMSIACDEIFGPVLSVLEFTDDDEVVALANDTKYGLAAGVWTSNIQRAHTVSRRLRAGTVWINEYRLVSCTMPFGGYRTSGYGRENGFEVLRDYTQLKSVWVELAGRSRDPFKM